MIIITDLTNKKISLEQAAKNASKNNKILSELLEAILSKKDEIRFNSYEVLLYLSKSQPEVLYTKWDYLAELLDSQNHYHRYIAINLLPNLAKADPESKFEKIFDNYFKNIEGEKTMVAGQAAQNSGKIAKAKPHLRDKITNILLNIDKIHMGKQTELMKAHAITALDEYFEEAAEKEKIIEFVKSQSYSTSPKTKKVAKEFLKKWRIE